MKKAFWLGTVLVLVATILPGVSHAEKAPGLPESLVFVAGTMGSSAYARAVAQSDLLQSKLGITVTPEPTPGALAMANLIKQGKAHLMATNAYDVGCAFRGEVIYKTLGRIPILGLQVGTGNPIGLLSRRDSGLKRVADLKGKRVVEFPTHPDSVIKCKAYLLANGLDPEKDVKWVPASSSKDGLEMVKMGRADTVNVSVRGGKTKDFDVTVGGIFLQSAHDEKAEALARSLSPAIYFMKIEAGSPACPEDTYILSHNTIFAITANASDELAYLIVKTCIENEKELVKKAKAFKGWNLKQAVGSSSLPFHNGAIKYYKERGVWTEKQEAMQKKLLR